MIDDGELLTQSCCGRTIGSEDVFQYCACLSRVHNIGYHSRNYYGEGVESAWAFSIVESLLLVPTGVLKGGFVHPLDPHAGSALLHLKHMSVKICACLIHCCLDIMWWWLSCWKKGKESISKRVLCHARDQISCQGTCSTMSKTVSWLCLILDCQVLDPIFLLCSASHIEGGRLKSLKDEIECNEELFILVSWEWLLWISIAPCLFAFFFPVFLVSFPLCGFYFFRVGCKVCCIVFPTYNEFLFSKSILKYWNLWCLCTED